jgi:hypothetical protein
MSKMPTTEELLDSLEASGKQSLVKRAEPALNIGVSMPPILGVILTLLYLVPERYLTDETASTIFAVLAVIIPVVTAYLIRRKVWSPQSVARVIADAEEAIQALEKAALLKEIKESTSPPYGPHKSTKDSLK